MNSGDTTDAVAVTLGTGAVEVQCLTKGHCNI